MRLSVPLKTLHKSILLLLFFLLITLAVSSCADTKKSFVFEDDSQQAGKQKIKLRFINSWGGSDASSGVLNQIFKEFMEKNPNIEIINESVSGEDFLPKIKTDFASGYDPDVFGLWPGSDIRALIKANKVADLTDLLNEDKEWKDSFKDNSWNYTTDDGRIYGLPYEIIFESLFINKDLFDWYDVKVPQNYEDLKIAIKSFKSRNIVPIAYNSQSEGTFLYQNIIASIGGKYCVENSTVNNEIRYCYVKAMNYMKELYDLGAFPDNAFTLSNKDRDALFINKKAAMIAQGSWFIGKFTESSGRSVDIIPFPVMEGATSTKRPLLYGFGCGTFYMSKASWDDDEKRKASILLLKELTSKKWVPYFAATGMISNINMDVSEFNYNLLTQKGLFMIDNAKELVGPADSFVNRAGWEEWVVPQFPYVLEGNKTPEEVWNKYMEDYGYIN